ncbi:MAG: NADH-ubiquinone oxidoreductase-F iron-sulfur binding region domain-containing protein [Thermodesulfobacteriota bacterium]
MKVKSRDDLDDLKKEGLKSLYPDHPKITVGMATCGIATGARKVFDALVEEVEKRKLDVAVSQTGCIGFCQKEPLVDILSPGKERIYYKEMSPEKAVQLLDEFMAAKPREDWALFRMGGEENLIEDEAIRYVENHARAGDNAIPLYKEFPFFKKQVKVALRNCGFIDSERIEEYIAKGGYYVLLKVLTEMKPEEVIEEVKRSGLRGRGGGGFPTGVKWESCRNATGEPKYIICNADEGDPGAYMDRSVLEGDPHGVIEGMIIGAYAIGAHEGFIYVRNEYPLAIQKLTIALTQAEKYGLLGEDILGTDFRFTIKINRGGGAFVCGESTALMASLEGKVGEPKAKYIHTVERGLRDRPSNLNNVETWANVPLIINKGADWFASIGTEGSKGTKVFSIVGKVNNTGLVEVPMGMTLREIIYDIGGGIHEGKKFKAVQTGGPSGGFIPETLLGLPVDFDKLFEHGSMMGSGGMIVIDEDTCIVDVTKYFLDFLADESCGKCIPSREGIWQMLRILNRICQGEGSDGDIELLKELGETAQDCSLCALGQTAPNPVLSSIKYFRGEYEAHIKEKRCPARVCKALMAYYIDPEKCEACMSCLKNCPVGAIKGGKDMVHVINQEECTKCGICFEICPPRFRAVTMLSGKEVPSPAELGVEHDGEVPRWGKARKR